MASEKTATYTAEQTIKVLEMYQAGETPETIAEAVGKSTRSVIAKLAREGVYQAKESSPKRMKKAEMVRAIAAQFDIEAEKLESLEKATHEALELLLSRVKGSENSDLKVAAQ